jgi:hypothetical protein
MGLSIVGMALLAVSAWIGGALVHVHGVGVAGHVDVARDPPVHAAQSEPAATRLGRT